MKNISLLILCFLANLVYAQNYDLVIPDKVNYFLDYKDFVHEFRVDSFFVNNSDTIYSSFDRVRKFDTCTVVLDAPIFGKAIVKKQTDDWLIVNAEYDTLIIKTNIQINDIWNCFNNLPSQYIEAKYESISYENVFGSTQDSVRTISFQLKDSLSGNLIISEINNIDLEISKNNGIISMPDFALFPFIEIQVFSFFENFFEPNAFSQLRLDTIISNSIVREELKYSYYFNYEIGDIFQTLTEIERGTHINGNSSFTDIYNTYTVVSKNETLLNFDYILEFESFENSYGIYGEGANFYSEGLKTLTVPKDSFFFKESFYENQYLEDKPTYSLNKSENDRLYSFNLKYNPGHNYLGAWIQCSFSNDKKYFIKGIGGPFEQFGWQDTDSYERGSSELIYFKKGSEEWGQLFNSVHNVEKESNLINIYPNPNNGNFNLTFENNKEEYLVKIYDLLGKEIKQIQSNKNDLNLDLSIENGVYFLQIEIKGNLYSKKFVVN